MVADRGGYGFALPLTEVVRVVMSPRIVEAPLMPAGYVGVIEFDGVAVPVWDPFSEAADAMWGATVVVAQCPAGNVGFLSDGPPRVAAGAAVPAEGPAQGPSSDPADAENADVSVPTGPMWSGLVSTGDTKVPLLVPSRFETDQRDVRAKREA